MLLSIRVMAFTVVSLAILGIRPAYTQTCVPPPPGLVGWWPGDGAANDVIAGNDGHLVGDATFAPAIVGQGFSLDGFGDYVEIPDSAALKPPEMSVESWVRFDSLDTPIVSQFGALGLQYIVFKKNSRVFNFEGYALRKQRQDGVDRLAFSVADANGVGGDSVAYSTTPVVAGQSYHVVGTYDGSYVRVYVNGLLEGYAAVSVMVDYGTRPVFVGTSGEVVFDGKLHGVVDEPSIYNRALDAAEIVALYVAGQAGKCSSASALIAVLQAFVESLDLPRGISNSLTIKLQNALRGFDAEDSGGDPSVCRRIDAFLSEVSGQTGKALTDEATTQLTDRAEQVKIALACL